ncbi:MAG: DUF2505 family protein [Actinomycetota bacterium]|nr:DUF2505 family protein [Actinomycetota bacterium]
MRFSAEHRFPAGRAAVAAVLGDPDFYRTLALPDLRLIDLRLLDEREPSGAMDLGAAPGGPGASREHGFVVRYEFTGTLEPIARRLLGGSRLTWTQELHVRGESGGSLSFAAEANPRLLRGRADYALVARGSNTIRHLDGELVVAVPFVGAMAERRIVAGVLHRLDVEAAAVREHLECS